VKFYKSAPVLRDLMGEQQDDEKLDLLPGGWQIVGDIVITSLQKDLFNETLSVGEALLRMHPHCKSVYLDNGITGKLRLPKRELMAARPAMHDTGITIHVENGCRAIVPEKLLFLLLTG
jgi:tRNA wybutosine-synthesizing protein 2